MRGGNHGRTFSKSIACRKNHKVTVNLVCSGTERRPLGLKNSEPRREEQEEIRVYNSGESGHPCLVPDIR